MAEAPLTIMEPPGIAETAIFPTAAAIEPKVDPEPTKGFKLAASVRPMVFV
jgi:hypothetical protein